MQFCRRACVLVPRRSSSESRNKIRERSDVSGGTRLALRVAICLLVCLAWVHTPGSGSFFGGNAQLLAETLTPKNVPDPLSFQGIQRASREWLPAWCTVAGAETTHASGILAADTPWQTPYYTIDSGEDGPTLLIVGGIHGNEPAGYRAALQIRHWPIVKGKLVVLPGANSPGLKAKTRYLPGEPESHRDLNRNFPGDCFEEGARGEIARCIWQFVRELRPDWILDLHEGAEFHVSHEPPEGKDKSVGSSLIFRQHPMLTPIAQRMQSAANALVTDPDRRFVLLSRGPKETSLVSACVRHLGAQGMILETTFNHQPLSLRTRQLRAMVNVLMGHLGMIERDCVDVMTTCAPDESIDVGLYDGPGTSQRGVGRLAPIIDQAPDMTLRYLGPADIRPAVLGQSDAIVAGQFHEGRVIAISPHPEATDSLHPIVTESIRWITGLTPRQTSFNSLKLLLCASHGSVLLVDGAVHLQPSDKRVENDERQPDPRRGLFVVWGKPEQLQLPFIRGGQIYLQWRDVQPAPGRYDFSQLDRALAQMHDSGRPTTVQINGNQHPDFLFQCIPSCPERLSPQVNDRQGTLQYWHPQYWNAYSDLLAAYGRHLQNSPHRDAVLGVRLNFNALGTEHIQVPPEYRASEAWTCPPAVPPGPRWSPQVAAAYQRQVIGAFIEHFAPQVTVFVRNNVVDRFREDSQFLDLLSSGKLSLFHTSSEVEPRTHGEGQYRAFLEFCRSGKTLGYAEPWADAWGRHGGKTDPRWCSPCQWNYWRLLVDLHCGISFIAVYGTDLAHWKEPEFRAAFEFAAKYAGYHASPSVAPGAWVALREGNQLKGDYTFLMQRLPGDATRAVQSVGPDDQRFGAWARVIPGNDRGRFRLDPQFANSLASGQALVRVTYLDDHRDGFGITIGQNESSVQTQASGKWQTAEVTVQGTQFRSSAEQAHIQILARHDLTLHMVEVVRVAKSE